MRKWLKVTFTIMEVVVLVAIVVKIAVAVSDVFAPFRDVKTNHLSDWDDFYARKVSRYFKLPNEATIIRAEECECAIMGWELKVRFKLPLTKSPQAWVKSIAEESGISRHKKSDFLYDAGGDVYKVEYLPEEKAYIVVYSWD